jgi:hypothetical protein
VGLLVLWDGARFQTVRVDGQHEPVVWEDEVFKVYRP